MQTKPERTHTPDTTYRCAGAWCPGLPWKASDRPHPVTCSYGHARDFTHLTDEQRDVLSAYID